MSFKSKLKQMQAKMAEMQEGYVPGGNFQPIPDGDYSFRVKATIGETDKAPARLQIAFCFVVAEGELEGRQVWNNCIIEDNKTGAQIARGVIEDLGYDWPAEELEVLEDIVDDITERSPLVEASAKSKENAQGYMNTRLRITNVLELPEGSEDGPGDADASEINDAEATEQGQDSTEEAIAEAQKQELLDLAASLGIDGFSTENELADMVEALQGCDLSFPRENFNDEEFALLEALAITNLVEKPAPKKAIVKPTITKKATPTPSAPAKVAAKPAGKIFSKKGKK
jgi:hypothetical protein